MIASKSSRYFPHEYNARNDAKLQKIMMVMGHEGKGLYWDLIEIMYEQGGRLKLSECEQYAFAMRSDIKKMRQLIDLIFEHDKTHFWSNGVLSRIEMINEKSEKAKQSAQRRWTKSDAMAMPTQSEGNAINKINKINKINIHNKKHLPTQKDFESISVTDICSDYQVSEAFVLSKWDDVMNYCLSNNKTYSDYSRTLRNWVKKDAVKIKTEGNRNAKRISVIEVR